MIAWHAGAKEKTCGRCGATEKEPILVTPILMGEPLAPVTSYPIDAFWAEGETAPAEGATLADVECSDWWVSSPLLDEQDPSKRIDIDEAEYYWTDESVLLSSLQLGDTVSVHIAVPEAMRDTYEDTDVALTLVEREAMNPLS